MLFIDSAPAGMELRIATAVKAVPGVLDCHNLRIRYSGPKLFIDLHVLVDGNQSLNQAHHLTEVIENRHRADCPARRRDRARRAGVGGMTATPLP